MSDITTDYGTLTEPTTLQIRRLLPGPAERVWAYLTQGDLRRQWLAAGDMEMKVGAPFTLTWRNDEFTAPGDKRPEGLPAEHSMPSRITELDPPRKLAFAWNNSGEVSFELAPKGDKVLLTVTHRRLPDRAMLLKVAAGWHAHLDVLVARATGVAPPSFWAKWARLQQDYDARLPA